MDARGPSPSLPLALPLTLFVAAPGFEAWLEREWFPAERAIAFDLARLPGGGGDGEVTGRKQRPVHVRPGDELHLEDADGNARWIRLLKIVGRSTLVEYRREPYGAPFGQS